MQALHGAYIECTSTIPRNPRNHVLGDNEGYQTSHRRALEDLVSKLFPGLDTADTEAIVKLSREIDDGNIVVSRKDSKSEWEAREADINFASNLALREGII
jgi:hypothetical protein